MLFALGVFSIAALAVLATEQYLLRLSHELPVGEWLTEHLYSPLLRVMAVLLFVLAAYPQLFGLSEAPSVGALLAAGSNRFDKLINWLLLVSLLLPLLPLAERLPGLLLPAQGVTACCVLFDWLAASLDLEVRLWMGWPLAFAVLAIGLLASVLARFGLRLEDRPAWQRLGGELLLLFAQLPAISLYARALGRQLPVS